MALSRFFSLPTVTLFNSSGGCTSRPYHACITPASARIATSVIFCVADCGSPGGAQGGAPDPRKPPGRAPLLFFPGPPRQMPRVLFPQPCRCGRPKPPAGGFTSDNRSNSSKQQQPAASSSSKQQQQAAAGERRVWCVRVWCSLLNQCTVDEN